MPSPAKYKFRLTEHTWFFVLLMLSWLVLGKLGGLLYDAAYGAGALALETRWLYFVLKCLLGLVIGVAWLSMVFLIVLAVGTLCQLLYDLLFKDHR